VSSEEFNSRLQARHEAAATILRDYDETRAPFVVYLRKFGFDVFHGPNETDRALVEDTLREDLPPAVGLFTIMGDPGVVDARQLMGRSPSLQIGGDDHWQEVLTPIIAAAEMIVSEFTFLSEGVRWELEACDRLGKALQTVLILPPQNAPVACLDHLEPLDRFPRALWADRLFTERLSASFAVADLVERLKSLGALRPEERRDAYATGRVRTLAPVSSRRLFDGHMAAAREWDTRRSLGEGDPRADYYYLWHRFRSAVAVGCLHTFEHVPLETLAFDFVYGYLEVLQGIAYNVVPVDGPGSFVTRDLVMKLVSTVRTMMIRYPDQVGVLSSYADATFARLGITSDSGE
jgi:hypothetical protein